MGRVKPPMPTFYDMTMKFSDLKTFKKPRKDL